MKIHDLYGFKDNDLHKAKNLIEKALNITLEQHDSYAHGNPYYSFGQLGKKTILLKRNWDCEDEEILRPEFPDIKILLYIDDSNNANKIKKILISQSNDITFLSREINIMDKFGKFLRCATPEEITESFEN